MNQTNEDQTEEDVKDDESLHLLSKSTTSSPRSDDSSSSEEYSDNASKYLSSKHYSVFAAIVYMVNYTVAAGILGVPYQYNRAGYILGTLIFIWTGWLTYISYKYVCNQLLRAEAVTSIALRYGLSKSTFIDSPDEIIFFFRDNVTLDNFSHELSQFKRNEYELNHMVGLFCGKKWRLLYEISFVIYGIVTLWGFMVLFGASLARVASIPGISSSSCDVETESNNFNCRLLYSFYIIIFWIWNTIIVLLDFTEQQFVQYGSFFLRFLIVLLIIITSIGLMYGNLYYSEDSGKYYKRTDDNNSSNTPYYGDNTAAWKWNGLLDCYATAIFAFVSQYCIPDVLHPLTTSDKQKNVQIVISSGMIILVIIFVITGLVVSLYFGNQTESVCTLAWKNFIGFFWINNGGYSNRPEWSYFIGYFIVLLPPIDLLCSFPLNATTIAQTMQQSICDLDKLNNDLNYSKKWKFITCVTTAAIPAILSLFIVRFSFVVLIAGMLSLVALYLIPAYSEYKSRQMCKIITNDRNGIQTPIMGLEKHTKKSFKLVPNNKLSSIDPRASHFLLLFNTFFINRQ